MILRATLIASLALVSPVIAERCELSFTVEITHGVGMIRPGTELEGRAAFATDSTFRQEGGSTAHLASGEMQLGPHIRGGVWTLITTARDFSNDLVGVYAQNVTGLSFAGVDFEGPMALMLYGEPGSRPAAEVPMTQSEWDALDVRRRFHLLADDGDMLGGDVVALEADCG